MFLQRKRHKLQNLGGTLLCTNSLGNVALAFLLSLQFNVYVAVSDINHTVESVIPVERKGLNC